MRGRFRRNTGAVLALLGSVAGLAASAPASAHADTLADAIALAYQSNPTLQSQRAQLRALDESYVQARAGFRPQANVQAQLAYQNGPSTLDVGVTSDSAGLNVTQPIYTGGLTSAQVRAAEGDIRSGREKLRQVEASVLQSVIQAYVDVRRDQQALAIALENVKVLRRQLDETKARFDVGQITRTDVAQAEARLAAALSQLSAAQAQLGVSRSNYVAVIGQSPGDLAPEPPLDGVPATVDQAFDTAAKNNPGILTADFAEQAAAARVAVAKSAYRPTLSLSAQLGYENSLTSAPLLGLQAGIYDHNITGSATLTQPLFAGGMNASRIREALENDNAQRIAVEQAQRQAVQSVAQAWNQLLAARSSIASNQEQVHADEVAYEGVRQEADVGLRTTLDVLNAEQELRNAQLALVDARHDQYVASASVLNAMGLLEAKALGNPVPVYDPETSFHKIKRAGSVPWEGVVAAVDGLGSPTIKQRPADADQIRPAIDATAPATPAQAGGQVMPDTPAKP
jgi:outer membrane protein